MKDLYEDIIHLPRPVSKKHPPMPAEDRAAQFAPFAALTGHGAAIHETERLFRERYEKGESMKEYDLSRFHQAQERDYETALSEIRNGRKRSHWIWYIFPQLKGLGFSSMADYYGIDGMGEAKAYLRDDLLCRRLVEISEALLALETSDPGAVMGYPDDLKLRSCMTLFALADPDEPVFQKVLEKYYAGRKDPQTVRLLRG